MNGKYSRKIISKANKEYQQWFKFWYNVSLSILSFAKYTYFPFKVQANMKSKKTHFLGAIIGKVLVTWYRF